MKIHLLSKDKTNFFDEAIYGKDRSYDNIKIVADISECDFVLLPHSWEYYFRNKDFKKLISIIEKVKSHKKKLIGITNGDYGYTPLEKESILLRRGCFANKKQIDQFELPRCFGDPIDDYYEGKMFYREKKSTISIGFCGKVNTRFLNELFDSLMLLKVNIQYMFNKHSKEPVKIYPTANRLRKTVIKSCNHQRIKNDFILRKKFKNGLLGKPEEFIKRHKSTREFYDNIKNNDYTLCMRGVGNYSIRFYQTVAMGRIPIFINTDCRIPFDDIIKWKEIIPWVDYNQISKLPEILLEYHDNLSSKDFIKQQKLMREIWEKYLSHDGFFNNIGSYLSNNFC